MTDHNRTPSTQATSSNLEIDSALRGVTLDFEVNSVVLTPLVVSTRE